MNEAMELIQKLADTLGVAASKLIEIYAQRAALEWVDFYLFVPFIILSAVTGVVCLRRVSKDDGTDFGVAELWGAGAIISTMLFVVLTAIAGGEFSQAYKATHAPEAYAIDQILKHVR